MINLIPNSAKKQVVREYWLRVSAVWMFLIGTGCLIVASLMLPTYMLLAEQLTDLQAQVDAQAAETTNFDTNASALTDAMKLANLLLASSSSDVPFLRFEQSLQEVTNTGIKISRIQFTRGATSTAVSLSGVAATRQDLADFRDAIEAHSLFEGVTLPLSSLVKNSNVLFDMTLRGVASTTTP